MAHGTRPMVVMAAANVVAAMLMLVTHGPVP